MVSSASFVSRKKAVHPSIISKKYLFTRESAANNYEKENNDQHKYDDFRLFWLSTLRRCCISSLIWYFNTHTHTKRKSLFLWCTVLLPTIGKKVHFIVAFPPANGCSKKKKNATSYLCLNLRFLQLFVLILAATLKLLSFSCYLCLLVVLSIVLSMSVFACSFICLYVGGLKNKVFADFV